MERDTFIFYRSYYEAIRDLAPDIKLEVLLAIIEYALDGRLPEEPKPVAKGMFTLVRPTIDANTTRYSNGRKGGRKPSPKATDAPKDQAAGNQTPKAAKATAPKTEAPAETPPTPLDPVETVAQLKASPQWIEALAKRNALTPAQVLAWLDDFLLFLQGEEKTHTDIKDAKRHFLRWLPMRLKAEQTPTAKPTTDGPTRQTRPLDNRLQQRGRSEAKAKRPEDYKESL